MTEKLSTLVDGYIEKRAALKLEPLTKEIQKQEANGQEGLVSSAETDDKLLALQAAFKPSAWLSGAAQRAKQISFVTHPLKFTHGDAKGSSIFAYSQDSIPTGKYLITAAVRQPRIDVDGNAAALDVAGLLQLQAEGSSLGQCIAQGDMSALLPFVENEDQLKEWRQGFELALVNTELRTHTLAKQVYFPCPDGTYYLISPLFASSLAHELFQRVLDSRFSEEAKSLRKLKREKLHSSQTLVELEETLHSRHLEEPSLKMCRALIATGSVGRTFSAASHLRGQNKHNPQVKVVPFGESMNVGHGALSGSSRNSWKRRSRNLAQYKYAAGGPSSSMS